MSLPLIPLVTILVIAFVVMLVGLRLTPKSTAPQSEVVPRTQRRTTPATSSLSVDNAPIRRTTSPAPAMGGTAKLRRDTALAPVHGRAMNRSIYPGKRANVALDSSIKSGLKGGVTLPGLDWIPQWVYVAGMAILVFSASLLLLLRVLAPSTVIFSTDFSFGSTNSSDTAATVTALPIPEGNIDASKVIKRLGQMDPAQYNSNEEFNTWGPSACSAAAMTAVINSYGNDYRITDILKVEIEVNAISAELGLLEQTGIHRTVDKFGFRTVELNNAPLDSLIAVANRGWPIIISFPPGISWPGGHIAVVSGGDKSSVFIVDSSPQNITKLSRERFLQDWRGMALIVMPKDL